MRLAAAGVIAPTRCESEEQWPRVGGFGASALTMLRTSSNINAFQCFGRST
jgi:hypothetical protein